MESAFIVHASTILGDGPNAAWLRQAVLVLAKEFHSWFDLARYSQLSDDEEKALVEVLHAYRLAPFDPEFLQLAAGCRQRADQEAPFEHWLGRAGAAVRKLGIYPDLAVDKQHWFRERFLAGDTPEQAAQRADDTDLQATLMHPR